MESIILKVDGEVVAQVNRQGHRYTVQAEDSRIRGQVTRMVSPGSVFIERYGNNETMNYLPVCLSKTIPGITGQKLGRRHGR